MSGNGANAIGVEIVTLAKRNGPLTKHISLDTNGKLVSDGSACIMGAGTAWRTELPDMTSVASHIAGLGPSEAIALGRLRPDLPDRVEIITKAKLNGAASDVIARTGEFIRYETGAPALLLIDIDTKGMPDSVRARVKALLGPVSAIASVVPELGSCGCVVRNSTTTGLSRQDTGEALPGSEGRHIYVLVQDGSDIARALRTLHDRLWLAGLGWLMVGAAGQLLERSLVDRTVHAPERLVFEGAPILDPPLVQDLASRAPQAQEGETLDTRATIPDLTPVEHERLRQLKAAEQDRLKPDYTKARAAWVDAQALRLIDQRGVMPADAKHQAERLADGGVLLPDIVLAFDLPEFAGYTVADVLADPDRFVGATLADPLEGIEYGTGKARIMQRADGSLWIHSFAHGRTVYNLKYDTHRLRDVLAKATDDDVIDRFVQLDRRMAEISDIARERIRAELVERLGIGVRAFKRHEDAARARLAAEDRQRLREKRQRERMEAGDLRPQFDKPAEDAPLLIVAAQIDAVFAASDAAEPPMRDVEGDLAVALARRVTGTHQLTSASANAEAAPKEDGADQPDAADKTLPVPEHVLLTKLTTLEVAGKIEDHIDYVNKFGESVRLPGIFVRDYAQKRLASPLPTVASVATMPIILPDGSMLSGHHLDRERYILLRVPEGIEALLPRPEDCDQDAVAEAIHFLTDEWLVDVPTGYSGKLKLLTLAATILERSILPARPGYFVTAGRRSTGKTTVLNMIAVAALGQPVSASAWSTAEEERRKAILACLSEGAPLICWDNIKRGSTIACPHIDRALTGITYSDRVLGVTETRTVPANTVHAWTGNNIGPRGDTASRSQTIRLEAERPDPENRPFQHIDPIAWTYANRGRILRAIYTVILGNPRLSGKDTSEPQTRFKLWHHVVGSAFEFAAICHLNRFAKKDPDCPPEAISFSDEFLANDAEDEHDHALATVLFLLRSKWPGSFTAADILAWSNMIGDPDAATFNREFFHALETAAEKPPPTHAYSTMLLTFRLHALLDAPTKVGDRVMRLRFIKHHQGGSYAVEIMA